MLSSWVPGQRGGIQPPLAAEEVVRGKPGVPARNVQIVRATVWGSQMLHAVGRQRPQFLLSDLGVFFTSLTFALIEDAQAGEEVVRKRVAIDLSPQSVTDPALAVRASSVKLLETSNQPGLLLFKHFDIPERESQIQSSVLDIVDGECLPLRIHLIMSFPAFPENANGVGDSTA